MKEIRGITERQQRYVVALMSRHFGDLRKLVLKEEFGVESTKNLTFYQADEIIQKMNPDTFDNNWVAGIKRKAGKQLGQIDLFNLEEEKQNEKEVG